MEPISRRRLLKGAAATAAVLGTPLSAWPVPDRARAKRLADAPAAG